MLAPRHQANPYFFCQEKPYKILVHSDLKNPVLHPAAFLLTRDGFDAEELFALAVAGVIAVGIEFNRERAALRSLMGRYRNVPMSLADATLVRLSELHSNCQIFTLDTDFRTYRRHGNKVIPVLMPEQ